MGTVIFSGSGTASIGHGAVSLLPGNLILLYDRLLIFTRNLEYIKSAGTVNFSEVINYQAFNPFKLVDEVNSFDWPHYKYSSCQCVSQFCPGGDYGYRYAITYRITGKRVKNMANLFIGVKVSCIIAGSRNYSLSG